MPAGRTERLMGTAMTEDWRSLADRLVEDLGDNGYVTDSAWRRVFSTVPRHLFVPGTAWKEAMRSRRLSLRPGLRLRSAVTAFRCLRRRPVIRVRWRSCWSALG